MFYQKLSKRSREAMTGFLVCHYRYNTMNSWNQSTSYANNVKLPNLDVPQELQDLAYDVAGGEVEAPDWDMFFARTVTDFYRRTGYHIGFNGRSSGYLVLYEAKANGDGTYSIYPVGTRIQLCSLCNDERDMPSGLCGTVVGVDDQPALLMEWDNGRTLRLFPGEDDFIVIEQEQDISPGQGEQSL